MIEDRGVDPRAERRLTGRAFAILALALGFSALPGASRAAGAPAPTSMPELGTVLATNSDVLSEEAMSQQKGSGLRSPAVIGSEPSSPAKVLLWDEIRLAPLLNPPNDGVVTGGIGR